MTPARIGVCLVLLATVLAGPARAGDRYALVVSGASGGESYAKTYDRWRSALASALRDKLAFPPDHVVVLAEAAADGVRRATRDEVRKVFADWRGRLGQNDLLLVVLIGHGTHDGIDAKFNLVGPDLGAAEWRTLVDGLPGQLVFVNTTGASFPFLEQLSSKARVLITATDSAAQRFETVFAEFLIQAIVSADTDADKSGRLSVLEVFSAASASVRQWYEQNGQLATERAVLDDNGDGAGNEAGAPGQDGTLARRIFLDAGLAPEVTSDPALAALYRRRAALEAQIEELKARKDSMTPGAYESELERLLVELATVSRQIRSRS